MNQQLSTTNQELLTKAFLGKRVWLSGHTGFKGSWLSQWLLELGAILHGYALDPDTKPSLFEQLRLADRMEHEISDIRDPETVRKSIHAFQPDILFHMAAQPLVRRSYLIPVETYETNVLGTLHVLEALRSYAAGSSLQVARSESSSKQSPVTAIIVTTDKVYENHESGRPYEETDSLGGHDPYSSSKAMAEIVTAAYRSSYFQGGPIRVASARAGNVIGGGDWAEDRIVPDAMRALDQKTSISVRNPKAVRPWQHVLEPLSGYLLLAARIGAGGVETESLRSCTESKPSEGGISNSVTSTSTGKLQLDPLCGSFNFGPDPDSNRTVADLVNEILKNRDGEWTDVSDPSSLHEATLLNLSIDKAHHELGWVPKWNFETTIQKTVEWYDQVQAGAVTPLKITGSQIVEYQAILP